MFEVDWADYDSERVGQRRARKEAEQKSKQEKVDVDSRAETISTRTSCSSDPRHLGFFGSIGRKKGRAIVSKHRTYEGIVPEPTIQDTEPERSSIAIQEIPVTSVTKATDYIVPKPQNAPSRIPRPIAKRIVVEEVNFGWPESPDRSSKGTQNCSHTYWLTQQLT